MKAYRYNFDLDDLTEITIKDDWNCPLLPRSFQAAINCANCGKAIQFGKSFTSIEVQTAEGLGFWVCKECHERELRRRARSRRYQQFRKGVVV